MSPWQPQRAECAVCGEEKNIHARGGCYPCYYAAQKLNALDDWLPKMATRTIRRPDSYTGTSRKHRKAERLYSVPEVELDPAHKLTFETEPRRYGPDVTRVVCTCGRFISSWWTLPSRAELAGAAHRYAMTFPVGDSPIRGPEEFAEQPVVLAYGTCYIHGDSKPCACIRGCTGCTGCLCYCDCITLSPS